MGSGTRLKESIVPLRSCIAMVKNVKNPNREKISCMPTLRVLKYKTKLFILKSNTGPYLPKPRLSTLKGPARLLNALCNKGRGLEYVSYASLGEPGAEYFRPAPSQAN
jgi:hypothetical protein